MGFETALLQVNSHLIKKIFLIKELQLRNIWPLEESFIQVVVLRGVGINKTIVKSHLFFTDGACKKFERKDDFFLSSSPGTRYKGGT